MQTGVPGALIGAQTFNNIRMCLRHDDNVLCNDDQNDQCQNNPTSDSRDSSHT